MHSCSPVLRRHRREMRSVRHSTPKTSTVCTPFQEKIASGWAFKGPGYGRMVLWVCAVLLLWGQPVAQLDPLLSWPLGGWLSQPHARRFNSLGLVAVVPWLSLSQRASACLVRALPF